MTDTLSLAQTVAMALLARPNGSGMTWNEALEVGETVESKWADHIDALTEPRNCAICGDYSAQGVEVHEMCLDELRLDSADDEPMGLSRVVQPEPPLKSFVEQTAEYLQTGVIPPMPVYPGEPFDDGHGPHLYGQVVKVNEDGTVDIAIQVEDPNQ